MSLQASLKSQGWEVNTGKIQGLGQTVKSLGIIWLGKIKVLPETVIDKIQAYPIPKIIKHLQAFADLLGYWRLFTPHLVQILRSFYALVNKGSQCDWGGY